MSKARNQLKFSLTQLSRAFERGQFELCYQPQYDLATGACTGVEALIRWKHPEKGLICPIDFIPLAENTGLIVPIGRWVLEKACSQNRAWQEDGLPCIRIAVNIAPEQLQHDDFIEMVQWSLAQSKLDPTYLELEISENALLDDEAVINRIHQLKALGIQVALDDFGIGYANLSHLEKLPIDRVKIDQEFVSSISQENHDEVDTHLHIRAVISISMNLNFRVLAEGVETETQKQFLLNERCHEAQGYYFSHPIAADEVASLLRQSK
ncbi:MAG: EAL domain-containing protein [Gammaproteobacteria bacterium]|nr:EAL domain-containing protein [Gammaproteobacteria bacterium]